MSTLKFIVILLTGSFLSFSEPKAMIKENDLQLGKFKKGESRVAVFTIKNISDERLIISKVRSSCGCAKPVLSCSKIEPGKSAKLSVKVTGGKDISGSFIKSVYLVTNMTKKKILKCSFFGTVCGHENNK